MEQLIGSLLEHIPPAGIVSLGSLALLLVFAKQVPINQLLSWLVSRRKTKLAFTNEQLEFGSLSPYMYNHLRHRRERLLLQITQGIDTDCFTAQAIMAVSKDMKPDGLYWSQLRSAAPFLRVDSNGALYVKIERIAWAILIPLGIVGMILFFLAFILLLYIIFVVDNVVNIILISVLGLGWGTFGLVLASPAVSIIAAREVRKRLEQMNNIDVSSTKEQTNINTDRQPEEE